MADNFSVLAADSSACAKVLNKETNSSSDNNKRMGTNVC
jgi:hypothetical protein